MILNDYKDIDKILSDFSGKHIAITTHENPDGDGLCACMALYLCLERIYGSTPVIVMDSEFPAALKFLNFKQCSIIKFSEFVEKYHTVPLLVVLDCHETPRVDTDKKIFEHAQNVLVIDHHIAKPETLRDDANYYFDAKASTTGVILHRFLYGHIVDKMPPLSRDFHKDYADFIYTTILNDTDNFINSNADIETFMTTADLMKLGLKPHLVANQFLYTKPINYFRFIGCVLSTIRVTGKIATFYSTLQMLSDFQLTSDAYSKMLRWTKGASDVEIQVLFQEYENDLWRISFRSDIHNVSAIAQHFGGGGHFKASGCQMTGKYDEVKAKIIAYIESQI